MKWNGEKLKALCDKQGVAINKLAETLSVSRPTIYSWFGDQVPKGHHLLKLCSLLDIDPAGLFDQEPSAVSVPVHRARSNARITDERRRLSHELAESYAPIFGEVQASDVLSVIRTTGFDEKNVQETARKLRKLAEIPEGKPCTYKHAFRLLERLGCYTIFTPLPDKIKSSAFFSEIHNHRVVFVNRQSNVLDLVFYLLHESVHAAFDEQTEISSELEIFCDAVAGAIQFPADYIHLIKELLKPLEPSQQKKLIKKLAEENGHVTYGLTKLLFPADKPRHQSAAKTDHSLRKKYPTLDQLFFKDAESAHFLALYHQLSPQYLELIASISANLSPRRVGELMGLESELDASMVKEELAHYMEA
ncbi:helix-turn-helix domain-containing protein [Pontiella sp.]|uniref:helix-turn-helix domain-containing protein n=1 Tax=Pontiella sp. TaxID=2837462 RepID=UPI003568B226